MKSESAIGFGAAVMFLCGFGCGTLMSHTEAERSARQRGESAMCAKLGGVIDHERCVRAVQVAP
jgi:uncharacterized protein YceK